MAINKLRNVVLFECGLGAEEGEFVMQVADNNGHALGGQSRIVGKGPLGIYHRLVEVVTIDNLVRRNHISIIHLDIEGFEQQALKGALKTIQRCLPILILEVTPTSTLFDDGWFGANIYDLGYDMTGRLHGNRVFRVQKNNAFDSL